MAKIDKITTCCQKVLPLVYDESLSYYEVLCKVQQKLNELIKINNNIRDEVHSDYLAVLEGAKVATEAVASVTAMRDEVLTLKQATEQYAHDVVTIYNETVEARDTAIAKANIAEQSATTASAKADIAQTSATTATEKANIAVQSAETATQKANIATEKADSAVQSATTATEKAESAVQSANTATAKADIAVESANTATAKADIAVESANTATEKANIASTSATTATQKAEIASTSADTAIAKAQEASASASTASTKASEAQASADVSESMSEIATMKATEAQTNADKVLTAMSLVSGTINYYKGDNIEMTIYGGENDSMSVTITPTIINNVLYIYGNVTQELTGQITIHLPNIVTKALNMTQVFDWAKTVLPNIDVNNLPYVTFGGGNGNTYTNGATQENLISTVAGKSIGAPWYSFNMQLFSNTLTEITVPYQAGTTLKYSFTIIQPLVFTNEVTPDPTDYITKLNEVTQAREQADTALQQNIDNNTSQIISLNSMPAVYWKTLYPVGSIYISTSSTFNPQTAWGGTWVKTSDGRCLIGANDKYPLGSTGGETEHTLTIDEIPRHSHSIKSASTDGDIDWVLKDHMANQKAEDLNWQWYGNSISYEGGGKKHNNMQPYLAVYIWERTA